MPSENSVQLMCPNLGCRRILAVPVSARGRAVRCRHCRTMIRVPGEQARPGSPKADKAR